MSERKEYYNYEEALEVIEEFMEESEIRYYCSNICKGHCCSGCYESKNACHRNEGRRIACSIFVCSDLKRLIFDEKQYKILGRVNSGINDALYKALENEKISLDFYHQPYPERVKEKFQIEKRIIDELQKLGDFCKISWKMMYLEKLFRNGLSARGLTIRNGRIEKYD